MKSVFGYKTVAAYTMHARLHGDQPEPVRWAMPGGETAIPRVFCDGPEVPSPMGRGLHVASTLEGARKHGRSSFLPRLLVVETSIEDVLSSCDIEIRATRWRTLAIVPPFDPRDVPQPQWYPDPLGMHGLSHALRVQLWAWLIAGTLMVNWKLDLRALCWAALLHDIGRANDGFDFRHGMRSAQLARSIVPAEVDIEKVYYLCYWHDVGHSGSPPEWIPELVALQDADALDLHRCTVVDPARLHTDAARALNEVAKLYATTGHCPLTELAAHPIVPFYGGMRG